MESEEDELDDEVVECIMYLLSKMYLCLTWIIWMEQEEVMALDDSESEEEEDQEEEEEGTDMESDLEEKKDAGIQNG